jgi:anti-anti-sigma factor
VAYENGRTVVSLAGEHDLATAPAIAGALAEARKAGDADVVVDLSAVTFLDASTLRVFVAARNDLHEQSRELLLRSPTRSTHRLLELCGLTGLLEPAAPPATPAPGALSSWVSVPATSPTGDSDHPARATDAPPSRTAEQLRTESRIAARREP